MSKKYTRSDLIADTASQTGVTKAQAEQILKAALTLVADAVRAGSTVEIREFATFKPVDIAAKPARTGRNPATGEAIEIAAKPARKGCNVKAKFKLDA